MTILHFLASERATTRCVLAGVELSEIESAETYAVLESMIARPHLKLIGLCVDLGVGHRDEVDLRRAADSTVGLMERVYREYRILMSELIIETVSQATPDLLVQVRDEDTLSRVFDDLLDDACARNRYPRPALIVMEDLGIRASLQS
ncbi:hypothetical protein [Rhodococcus sp. ARC_M6]|uniref:hypothetical protein n=1 Tax=Rhodococcus sp. ARC_M6 TaxID=2928852 RepID=UPI001FB3E549|nr:hypothetical protein [Rhodococcus sp. ARC_M6]MCJ0902088.1 hypothetical protein [Rhodococcus sp. ARC_M6]